jgi:guanylate kinase
MEIANAFQRRGLLFVLSSPSGAGKSTIARMLLESDNGIAMSVSATTRPKRPGEVEGPRLSFRHRRRIRPDAGDRRLPRMGARLRLRYATLRNEVLKVIEEGRDVLLDIDWQGTQQLKQVDPDIVRVFILPPSMQELERRLRTRGTDSEDVIQRRMARATAEISHWAEYDYVLINNNAEKCRELVHNILKAERLKATRRVFLHDFVREMIAELSPAAAVYRGHATFRRAHYASGNHRRGDRRRGHDGDQLLIYRTPLSGSRRQCADGAGRAAAADARRDAAGYRRLTRARPNTAEQTGCTRRAGGDHHLQCEGQCRSNVGAMRDAYALVLTSWWRWRSARR